MPKKRSALVVWVLAAACLVASGLSVEAGAKLPSAMRLNDIQARGTHNSYHRDPGFPGREAAGWGYSHAPLPQQLEDQGVRQVELDVHYNFARDDFEVYHAWFGDDRSTCDLLSTCLGLIREWSDAHAGHHPVMVLIEPKDAGPPKNTELPEDGDPFTSPFTETEYQKLDRVLLDSFEGPMAAGGRVITPDDVTRPDETLRQSIISAGWPRLGEVRQHVVFVLDGDDHAIPYSDGWQDLGGRAMFVQAEHDTPVAAFVGRDGRRRQGESRWDRIRRLVKQGFMIRDLVSPEEFEQAKAAGAHFLSTDYPDQLELSARADAPSRCNPVTTRDCRDVWVERHAAGDWTPPPDTTSDAPDRVVTDKVDRLVIRSAESALALLD